MVGGRPIFGQTGCLDLPPGGRPAELGEVLTETPVVSLSQEHGVIEGPAGIIGDLELGDLVVVWPVHSCLMCDLMEMDNITLLR